MGIGEPLTIFVIGLISVGIFFASLFLLGALVDMIYDYSTRWVNYWKGWKP